MKNKFRLIFSSVLLCVIIFNLFIPVQAKGNIFITTSLKSGETIKSSKKIISVIAKTDDGTKANVKVSISGVVQNKLWGDKEKDSFLLEFNDSGEYFIDILAEYGGITAKKIIRCVYKYTKPGEYIGKAIISVELFTIGCGYLAMPEQVNIYEGENAAQTLMKYLSYNGYNAFYSGTDSENFYLAYIASGTKTQEKFENYKNSYSVVGKKNKSKTINIKAKIPNIIKQNINNKMTYFDENEDVNKTGMIGEFCFSNGSSFMYSLNNDFSNVPFSDNYLSDGDVLRVQFTLCFGADIGGGNPDSQSKIYICANKDLLTKQVAKTPFINESFKSALEILYKVNASQKEVDNALENLRKTDKKVKETNKVEIVDVTVKTKVKNTIVPTTIQNNETKTTTNKTKQTSAKEIQNKRTTKKFILSEQEKNISNNSSNNYEIFVFLIGIFICLIALIIVRKKEKKYENKSNIFFTRNADFSRHNSGCSR